MQIIQKIHTTFFLATLLTVRNLVNINKTINLTYKV